MTEKKKVEAEIVEEEQEEVQEEVTDSAEEQEETTEAATEEEEQTSVETLSQELEETRTKMLRIAADAENFKKRMERDKAKLLKYAGENILRELLTSVDNLDRALEQGAVEGGDPAQKLEALLAGVELTKKGLHTMLERFEVTPLDALGQPFNPDEMDALTMEASEEIPANHVVTEFAKGYTFKDRVLRHAQVVVSSGPAEKKEE
ncbi:MAG: nucleotide exchange factor GrpE [Candidatus Electrothrix sp. GW3-4]|uniref:nucleotide exchange factor GrpE n=1 Tax=Candidatus Electrothrix sp. GW3-4 TaxID=3126740 RepID=UPI0030CE5725